LLKVGNAARLDLNQIKLRSAPAPTRQLLWRSGRGMQRQAADGIEHKRG
jgi:hypothetical protein